MTWLCRSADRQLDGHLASLISDGLLTEKTSALIVCDLDLMTSRLEELSQAFPLGTLHSIAVKANPLLEVLKTLVQSGAGLEVASAGELALALAAGCRPESIVFDSPAKTEAELVYALELGVRINANSLAELERLHHLLAESPEFPQPPQLGLRLNPAVADASRSSTTMVATPNSKFGLPAEVVEQALQQYPWLNGLHIHVGSQVATADDLVEAARRMLAIAQRHNNVGWLDIGGGLPARYRSDDPGLSPQDYAERLQAELPQLFEYPLITEVGRALQAGCGWAISRVEYADESKAITHLGADFALRECYQPQSWYHEIAVFNSQGRPKSGSLRPVDIYGPLCFSGDRLAQQRLLPEIAPGDLLLFHDIGAYTLSMWSRYCSRPMPRVVGYQDSRWVTVRRPETPQNLVDFWSP